MSIRSIQHASTDILIQLIIFVTNKILMPNTDGIIYLSLAAKNDGDSPLYYLDFSFYGQLKPCYR